MIDLPVLISAALYRCPRGGPSGDVWKRWIGFAPGSTVAALVWAVLSSGLIVLAADAPLWAFPAFALAMFMGEKVPYMRYATGDAPDYRMASLLGCAMLNPLLGPIYWLARKGEGRLPTFGPLIDGWTCYAELACGFVTAVGYTLLAALIVMVA